MNGERGLAAPPPQALLAPERLVAAQDASTLVEEQERRRPVRRFPRKMIALLWDAYVQPSRVWDEIAAEVAERDLKEAS